MKVGNMTVGYMTVGNLRVGNLRVGGKTYSQLGIAAKALKNMSVMGRETGR
jgi:hypothetical protein